MDCQPLKQLVFGKGLRTFVPYAGRMTSFIGQFKADQANLGRTAAFKLRVNHYLRRRVSSVVLAGYQHPLYYRPGTSDCAVIRQVFGRREYEAVGSLNNVAFIIDCGANIGCTAYYFLHAYPRAVVMVVEPDSGNMELCQRNLAPFGKRVRFVQAAVWGDSAPLQVVRGSYRDGQPWSFQVRRCRDGEISECRGITINELLEQSGYESVDLVKMDIEAAEGEVFSSRDVSWLVRTRNIAIELHDDDCRRAFDNAMRAFKHERRTSGELAICRGLHQ